MSKTQKTPSSSISEEDVRLYLKNNPGFLKDNGDLLHDLLPPDREQTHDNVADFQKIMLARLQEDIAELKEYQDTLIAASRNNMSTQLQVHEAVLAILDAEDINHVGHVVTQDWPDMLSVDVISLCFQKGKAANSLDVEGTRLVSKKIIDNLMGHDDACLLRGNDNASEEIFGPATNLIQAEALVRLQATDVSPAGILAFGSRNADMFAPGQGTELLRFLEAVLRRMILKCLKT